MKQKNKTMKTTEQIIQNYLESNNLFPIDFDEFYLLIGYSRKDVAKRALLNSSFISGEDYRVIKKTDKPGRPLEEIRLTVDCAKIFAFLATTPESKQIYRQFQAAQKALIKQQKALYAEALRDKQDAESRKNYLAEELKIARLLRSRDKPDETSTTVKQGIKSEHFPSELKELLIKFSGVN